VAASPLYGSPEDRADVIGSVEAGDSFALLDNSLGWAWGYAGTERRVGYIRSETLGL
jgi:hypothetical protein